MLADLRSVAFGRANPFRTLIGISLNGSQPKWFLCKDFAQCSTDVVIDVKRVNRSTWFSCGLLPCCLFPMPWFYVIGLRFVAYFTKYRRWLSSEIQGNVFIIWPAAERWYRSEPSAFVPLLKMISEAKDRVQRDYLKALLRAALENSYMYASISLMLRRFFHLPSQISRKGGEAMLPAGHTDTWTRLRKVRALMRSCIRVLRVTSLRKQ